MNDRILLLVAGLASAFAAWGFWRYLGQDAFDVMLMVALVCTMGDNWRLRRTLRRLDREDREPWR